MAAEARERAAAIKAFAEHAQVFAGRLGRERPREGDVVEARAGDIVVIRRKTIVRQPITKSRDAVLLRRMIDVRKWGDDDLAVRAAQTIGEDDGILRHLRERHDRSHEERVALALVPIVEIRMIENAVEVAIELRAVKQLRQPRALFLRLEDEIRLARLGVVG